MADVLKRIFLVPKCKRCGKVADNNNLCNDCSAELKKSRVRNSNLPINKKIDFVNEAYASYKYENAAKDIVLKAKFQNPAGFLASLLADISIDIQDILAQNNIDMIVPVPSHKSKLYSQEYDLPVEMTKLIAKSFATEYSHCVEKIRKTEKQHNLPKDKRKVNLVNAFIVNRDIKGKKILIIDDVITTGITVSTIAGELKLAGRDRVYVWAYTLNT